MRSRYLVYCSSEKYDWGRLGCDTVWSGRGLLTFRRNLLPLSWGCKNLKMETARKGKGKCKVSLSTPWRHIGGVEVWLHSFLALHWFEVSGQLQDPSNLHPEKNHGTHRIGGWVTPERKQISWPTGILTPHRRAPSVVALSTTTL